MILRVIAETWLVATKIVSRLKMVCYRKLFHSSGRNLIFSPSDTFSYKTISIGDDVFIGRGAHFSSVKSLEIGDRVMFGPNVKILGGNHNSELNGQAMRFNKVKRQYDDEPVKIEEDSWIGAGATILKGVTIGRGAIVGAAAVVTRDVEPYTIVAGCPAKLVKARGLKQEIEKHERSLYGTANRLTKDQLAHLPDVDTEN